ncbi:MAG: tetratricopeptide repeat protein [Bacteroidales bacterium]|nr:tetratricopeptide repeat protein [Bacteroidales bacterium]
MLDRKTEINKEYFSALWKNWLLLGLFMFLLSTTRNVGLGIVISVVLYLLLRKKFLPAFLSVIFWGFFYFLFNIYKKVVWNIEGVGFSNQLQNISYKHFYDHSQGTENFIGFVNRFIDNSNLYLSKHLSMMLGVRPLSSTIVSPALTIFFIILFVVSFYFVFKKYKQLLFIGIYIAVMLGVTFVTQQKHWDQERLILIYLPLICVFIGVGFYELFHLKLFKKIRLVPFIVFSLLCLSVFYQSIRRIDITSLQKNIKGDIYYGYTEDWVNYLKISEWAGNNLSDDAVILCRKASMSEIYGQREFFGIFRSPSTNPDSVYYFFEKNGITHVIMGSLRKFSKTKTQYTITTIRKTLMSYILKYPLSFNLVHKIGESEPGYLFEVVKKKNLNDEELIRIINSSIIINPNASYYYILGGRKMLEKKKFNDAKAYYNRMIQLDTEKKFFQAYFGRGVAYLELHEYSKAINDFLEVVKIKPENAEAWYNLGLCYNKLENIKTANEVFLKARELGYSSN